MGENYADLCSCVKKVPFLLVERFKYFKRSLLHVFAEGTIRRLSKFHCTKAYWTNRDPPQLGLLTDGGQVGSSGVG